MIHTEESDVCIVGGGAAGAVVAAKLAGEGLTVHLVEQGRQVKNTNMDDIISASEPALARLENGAWGPFGYPWTTCNLGGGTVFYGAASFRLRRVDFDAGHHLAGSDIACNWPISYEQLRPHYDALEAELGLSGPDPSCDPTHPGGAAPLLPPLTKSPQARRLTEAAYGLSLNPFETPLMIVSREFSGRPACNFCSPCIEHKCESGAKFDAYRHLLEPLERTGEIDIFVNTKAVRLVQARAGKASVLEAIDMKTGGQVQFRARRFVLTANAIQSAALLMRSSETLSHGTSSGRDLVGRGLCMKLNEYVVGYSDEAKPEIDGNDPWSTGGGPFSTLSLTDHYTDPACPSGLGGLIYEARFGWNYGTTPQDNVARLECLIADTPSRQNRVRLASSKDKLGLPEIVIDYRAHPRDLARLGWLGEQAERWLGAAGYRRTWREPGGYALGSSHLHGTCRAGVDPNTSVVNQAGRLHGVDNVFVADGGYMPFPGAVNPTLTIQAVASHVADHVRDSLSLSARRFAAPRPATSH